ncbi:MAG: hypothetical protein V1737_04225 [Chloroflexota bacterium]
MGKKSRKRRQYSVSRQVGPAAGTTEGPAGGTAVARPTAAAPQKRSMATPPRGSPALPDFGHVRKDLWQVGVLGAGMVVLLVILALVLG